MRLCPLSLENLLDFSTKIVYIISMVEITRTTKLKIGLPFDTAQSTVQAWTDACNYVSQVAFKNSFLSNAARLHKLTYSEVRKRFGLTAQVSQSVIRHVASKYVAARTAKRKLKAPVKFRLYAVALQGGPRGRDFSFTKKGLSVSTVNGRVKSIPFHGAPHLTEYLSTWSLGDARLSVRKNKVFLSVSFKTKAPEVTKPNDAVVGVDRGINYLAVATDGKRSRFYGGGRLKHVHERHTKTRASLQRKKAERKTRSLRRTLKRLSGRGARFTKDANHVVSKRIVQFARKTGNPIIAIEKLDGIRNGRHLRKEQRTDLNRWPFYQLEQFLRYKAANYGFEVIEVEAKDTSKGCSCCGYADSTNRKGRNFVCKACGYRLHADLNASRNIRLRGILARQALWGDGLPSASP